MDICWTGRASIGRLRVPLQTLLHSLSISIQYQPCHWRTTALPQAHLFQTAQSFHSVPTGATSAIALVVIHPFSIPFSVDIDEYIEIVTRSTVRQMVRACQYIHLDNIISIFPGWKIATHADLTIVVLPGSPARYLPLIGALGRNGSPLEPVMTMSCQAWPSFSE